ncbi:hypothetical protein [uncultured Amphritea sp.]|uniref:hypothetical protein n=1 Tax=uncultured Amphritea sp. TaxID=981605 RepID=UPI0026269DCA|nr:hypothetical protein [uncultured Amphritea sp.]
MNCYWLAVVLSLAALGVVPASARSVEQARVNVAQEAETQTKAVWLSRVRFVNSSTHNVYGHYSAGNDKGTVGVLTAGSSIVLDAVLFSPEVAAQVEFRCDKADQFSCADGWVDLTGVYPHGDDGSVTTVFTFVRIGEIRLSFEVSGAGGDPTAYREIVIGNISRQ